MKVKVRVKALYFVIRPEATLYVAESLQIHPPKVSTALALADTYFIIWSIVWYFIFFCLAYFLLFGNDRAIWTYYSQAGLLSYATPVSESRHLPFQGFTSDLRLNCLHSFQAHCGRVLPLVD